MSFRKFIRELKLLSTEPEISQKISDEYPQHATIKTSARRLEAIMIQNIATTPPRNIVEMLKVVNTVLPIIAKDATQQSIYLNIRNAIKARYPDESNPIIAKAYKIMRFNQAKFRANKLAYNAKVFAANADKKQISLQKVVEVMDLVKDSTNELDVAIGLQLACGARISEVLSYSQFAEAKNDSYIIQTGILKQTTDNPRTSITKPVLHYTRAHFFEMLTYLRSKFEPLLRAISEGRMTHAELSQRYNPQINSRIRSLFNYDSQDNNNNVTSSHMLRKIYANFSYDLFANKNRVSEASWVSNVLGHDQNSLSTAASYSTVSLVDTPIDPTIIPRNSKARDGHAYDRLLRTVDALRNNFKPITARILKSYGYGSETIDKYMKANSAPN